MSQTKIIDELVGTATTTNGSTATILSSTPPNDINTLAFAWVIASAAGEERAKWVRSGTIRKSGAGVVTLDVEEDLLPMFSTNGIKHSTIAVVISGGTVSLDVTGDPGFVGDIFWQATVKFYRS